MRTPLQQISWLGLGALAFGLAACPSRQPAAERPAVAPPAPAAAPPRLVEHPLGKSGFRVSLPTTYALKTTDAADFVVYYFAPADTMVQTSFTGGLYFGGHPQEPDSAAAGCQVQRRPTALLGRPATWTVQRCATGYTLNAVFDSHSGRGWDEKINAFGEAKSAAELRQLLAIFATLRQPAPAAR